ncbi:MAG: glutathione peroxidase [Bdellovibrionota bacterium]|nr:glutathione peroxidase [Bdellovibrionota bacterium]
MNTLEIEFETNSGEKKSLKDYPGKAYLIVNTASRCGLTPHYKGLQEVHEKYEGKGLVVLGFPANDFLEQEPGTDSEIQEFCQVNFGVNFPLMKKITVKGDEMHPLYKSILSQGKEPIKKEGSDFEEKLRGHGLIKGDNTDQIHWNFEKFLLNENGEVVERFFPDVEATDPLVLKAIEKNL